MRITAEVRNDPRTDEEVVAQVVEGETALFEILIRRYNQRLYRILRCILHEETEIEDVMQEAYVSTYRHLAELKSRAKFSMWLTRIAIREALARMKRHGRFEDIDTLDESNGYRLLRAGSTAPNPEEYASTRETACAGRGCDPGSTRKIPDHNHDA